MSFINQTAQEPDKSGPRQYGSSCMASENPHFRNNYPGQNILHTRPIPGAGGAFFPGQNILHSRPPPPAFTGGAFPGQDTIHTRPSPAPAHAAAEAEVAATRPAAQPAAPFLIRDTFFPGQSILYTEALPPNSSRNSAPHSSFKPTRTRRENLSARSTARCTAKAQLQAQASPAQHHNQYQHPTPLRGTSIPMQPILNTSATTESQAKSSTVGASEGSSAAADVEAEAGRSHFPTTLPPRPAPRPSIWRRRVARHIGCPNFSSSTCRTMLLSLSLFCLAVGIVLWWVLYIRKRIDDVVIAVDVA